MSGNWKLFINKSFPLEKNWQFYLAPNISIELCCLSLVSREELKWENDLWSFDKTKKFTFALFYKEKKKPLLDKLLQLSLNQGYMLFVINMNFYAPVFAIIPSILELIVNLKDWLLVISKWLCVKIMLAIAEKRFVTLINVSACPYKCWNKAPCFLVLSFKPRPVLKLIEHHDCPDSCDPRPPTSPPKKKILHTHFA